MNDDRNLDFNGPARRRFLRLGLFATAAPLIVTLAPSEARAIGSWHADEPYDPADMRQIYGGYEWRRAKLQRALAEEERLRRFGGFGGR